jgi:hypothetical protein
MREFKRNERKAIPEGVRFAALLILALLNSSKNVLKILCFLGGNRTCVVFPARKGCLFIVFIVIATSEYGYTFDY